jgi:tRNA (mo5U34)-methyltransferase
MRDLLARGQEFLRVLAQAKSSAGADFEWYRYHSLSNLAHIDGLLGGRHDYLLDAALEKGLLDVGCADGDLSFFFESLGAKVTAVDHPTPNHNGMRGVRKLKEVLHSNVEIREVDLDSQFAVPEQRFGLTLFLGALYHLKNPFYILETLAKCSEYCIVSTRIARRFPHVGRVPEAATVAYLLDAEELNADNSNFWIFSNAGLKLLLQRTRWTICEYQNLGDTADSDANSLDRDERAFCLLRSRYGLSNVELVSGFHEIERGGWRWTKREFAIRVVPTPSKMTMKVFLPPELLAQVGPMRMDIFAGAGVLSPAVFDQAGVQSVTRSTAGLADGAMITFRLDRGLDPDGQDPRERGIIVADLAFD